jgi:hypothetical protein
MAEFIRHEPCPKCGSKDNLAVYSDGSTFCWSHCGYMTLSEEYKSSGKSPSDFPMRVKSSAGPITKPAIERKGNKLKDKIAPEKVEEIQGFSFYDTTKYRGISEAVNKFYGVRTSYDEDGSVIERYYPITNDNELGGYKVREHPKQFSSIGAVGNTSDLFGAHKFRSGGKYVLIVEGEEDTLAAFQMLSEYAKSKNSEYVTAVVSITTGAGNPSKQLAQNYDFLNSFDIIVLGLDNDEAGNDSIEKCVAAMPKGKVRIAKWTKHKDPNLYLQKGSEKQFLADFYNAKQYVPAGVVPSSDLYDKILQQAEIQKVLLPPFAKKLEGMLGGGLMLGHIYNLAAMTSIGKTAIVNEFVHYWIFNSPHKVGVVSMELNAGQYGETMLSRHIEQKIARLSPDEKKKLLESGIIRKKGQELFLDEDGSPRFFLVDDRDGTVEQLQGVIEEMVIGSGVKIVVIDPLQDMIEGMTNEEQSLFMKWCKSMVKSHNISFVLINHMRKSPAGTNGISVSESDIMGSSTIMKSASANILFARDKEHEDEVERNTTYVTMPKNRVIGDTGPAGKWYYDKHTHVMHDFDEYWEGRPRPIPPGQAGEF